MTRALVLLVLWLLQAALVVLLINADWISTQVQQEQRSVAQQFGNARHATLEARSQEIYAKWFVASGIQKASYTRLLPDHSQPQHGMEGLAPWFFVWLEHRLDAFWRLVFQGIHRVQILCEWLSLLLLIIAAAVIDGVIQRRIRRSRHEPASADRYLIARRALLCLIIAPLLYLSFPIAVTPFVVPIWGGCIAFALMLMTAHAQHRV